MSDEVLHERLLAGLDELKARSKGLEAKVDAISSTQAVHGRKIDEINGDVRGLKAWRREVETEARVAKAYAAGAATALVSRAQWRMVAGFLGAVTLVAGAIVGATKALEAML